ncbi:MAG: type I secretion system permease/ATPase [Pseudomonadota bacterium]
MTELKAAKKRFNRVLLAMGGFSLVLNLLLLTMPLYMLQIYDRILPSRSMDTLIFLSLIAAVALLVLGLLEAVRSVMASRAAAALETGLGPAALRVSVLNNNPMQGAKGSEGGGSPNQSQVMRDLTTVRSFIASRGLFALLDLPFAPLFVAVIYFIHPTLFWLTTAGAVVLLFLAVLNQVITARPTEAFVERQGGALAAAQALSGNSATVRAMGMTENGVSAWGAHAAEALKSQALVDTRNAIMTGLSKALRMALQIAILGVGAWLVLEGQMTAGMIFAASIISGRALQPIDQVIAVWKQFGVTRRSWRNLSSLLERHTPTQDKTTLPPPNGEITVDSARIMSPLGISKPPVLNHVSFRLQPGELLGVVGPSGSGKSTLARLLTGAQKTHSGAVRLDGNNIEDWDMTELGRHIGYVGQEVELFPGTVRENIARLSSQPDDSAVLEAAGKAQVHELIQNLPNGYDTVVGAGGLGLSGGQKQRIALARAFYGNPRLMVLDEPNANLDEEGEMALFRALLAAKKARVTTVIITQRKQVLKAVDKILRLHSGTVDFFGTRDDFVDALQKVREQTTGRPSGATMPPVAQNKNTPRAERMSETSAAKPAVKTSPKPAGKVFSGTWADVAMRNPQSAGAKKGGQGK